MNRVWILASALMLPCWLSAQAVQGRIDEAARILPGRWSGQCGPNVSLDYTFKNDKTYHLQYRLTRQSPNGSEVTDTTNVDGQYELMVSLGRGAWPHPTVPNNFVGQAITLRLQPNHPMKTSIRQFSYDCAALLNQVVDARVGFDRFGQTDNLALRGSDTGRDSIPIHFSRVGGPQRVRPINVDDARPELQTQCLEVFSGKWRIRQQIDPRTRANTIDTYHVRLVLSIEKNGTYSLETIDGSKGNSSKETGQIYFREVPPDRENDFAGLRLGQGPAVEAAFVRSDGAGTHSGRITLIGSMPWGTPIDMLHYKGVADNWVLDFFPANTEERLFH